MFIAEGSAHMEESESRAQALVEGAGDGAAPMVLVEDDQGTLRVLDEGSGAIDAATLIDAQLADLVAAGDLAKLQETHAAARQEQQQRACQVRLVTADGPWRWFEVRYLPGVASEGHLVLLRDVTQLRRLAAEAEVLRRITELANSITDADEAIRRAVADLRETLGWRGGRALRVVDDGLEAAGEWATADPDDQLPDVVTDLAPDGTRVAALAAARGMPVTTAETGVDAVPTRLQQAGVAAIVAVPVVAADVVAGVLEFHAADDVGIDADQRSLLAEVGRQLGWVVLRQRSLEELEASHAELARSNAELERFAYVASHDLQEPLRKIIGFTELLQQHHEPVDDDEAEYRRYVIESAYRLKRLIKDLLSYSRAGRRELAQERVDLQVVVGEVLDDLALAVEEQDATIEVGELPVVVGDDGQLREVFQNLVSNALKYRAPDRPSLVRISEVAPDGDDADGARAEVVVADNGIGIDPGQRDAVFEVFRRLHPAHAYGGTGLGLALVQRIVGRHDGTVSIRDSPVGDGIAVHMTLPRYQEQP